MRLTPQTAPVLTALLERAGDDRSVVGAAEDHRGTKAPLYRQGQRAGLRASAQT
ncbi:hypothetical protein ACRAWD_21065 [Caulobacter segnis]